MEALIEPSLATVRAVIEKYCGLHAIPCFATMHDLGIDVLTQHSSLRQRLLVVFGKQVTLDVSDTVHTITDKLLAA